MRGKPGRTERVIGASILVILVLILAAFLLTSGLLGDTLANASVTRGLKVALGISDRPLFQIDPAYLEAASADDKSALPRSDVPEIPEYAATLTTAPSVATEGDEQSVPVVPSEPPAAAVAGRARFVDLGDANILPPVKTERYTDNLYEKIDGREGQFRAFHFVELLFERFKLRRVDRLILRE